MLHFVSELKLLLQKLGEILGNLFGKCSKAQAYVAVSREARIWQVSLLATPRTFMRIGDYYGPEPHGRHNER